MKRQMLPKNVDSSVFRATAERTKIVNVSHTIPRGGIRL